MNQDFNSIIRRIAKQEGVTEHEVIDKMQKAIDAGYDSPDPAVQSYWASMPFNGKPTPQELIVYLAGKVRGKELYDRHYE